MSETEPRQERRRAWVWWVGGLAALLVLGAALQPILLPRPSPVTEAAYETIENGMTLAEVERIMGGPPGDYETRPTVIPIYSAMKGNKDDWRSWRGDEGLVEVCFDPSGVATGKLFHTAVPVRLGSIALIRWHLHHIKDRWFPPSP